MEKTNEVTRSAERDREALETIQAALSGVSWGSDTVEYIASVLELAGYHVDDMY
jgi:hypothetical protein